MRRERIGLEDGGVKRLVVGCMRHSSIHGGIEELELNEEE